MSTFDRIASLPVEVEEYSLRILSVIVASGRVRVCTLVTLTGGGAEDGVGEDVTYNPGDHEALIKAGACLDFRGRWTLAALCDRMEELDLFPVEPVRSVSRIYRLWAFHSAALDLCLRQNGLSLCEALGRDPRPVRYVVSLRLGEPPTLDPVLLRLRLDPTLRFKLDATSSWTPELIDQLVATETVDLIDLKSFYRNTEVDQRPDPVLYRRVAEAFPKAWLEDADILNSETLAALGPHRDRLTWDVPIRSAADITALRFKPRMVNIKPSRIGSLRRLCEIYDYCAAKGIAAYGGGQTELGSGRGQAQYLAALFHPDGPNDLAPAGYNQPAPPADLPCSPLGPVPSSPGFRWG